jgi:hypothetical protein
LLENALLLFFFTGPPLEMPSNTGAATKRYLLLLLLLLGIIKIMLELRLKLRLRHLYRQLYNLQGFSFLVHKEYR